jgi:hypothetical protein
MVRVKKRRPENGPRYDGARLDRRQQGQVGSRKVGFLAQVSYRSTIANIIERVAARSNPNLSLVSRAEVNRLRLMHEAAIAKMEEEVARGRVQSAATAAAEAAAARVKISSAMARAAALEAELSAARTESAAAALALAALQSELMQSARHPVPSVDELTTAAAASAAVAGEPTEDPAEDGTPLDDDDGDDDDGGGVIRPDGNPKAEEGSSSRASADRVRGFVHQPLRSNLPGACTLRRICLFWSEPTHGAVWVLARRWRRRSPKPR